MIATNYDTLLMPLAAVIPVAIVLFTDRKFKKETKYMKKEDE